MSNHSVFSGALLVAGTTIGGGMLALPVLTAEGGFLPSLVLYLLCWLFMTATGLLLSELALHMKPQVNLVSMAENTLGFFGKIVAWGLYLFLFYCLTIAYVVGCADLLNELSQDWIPRSLAPLIFVLLFAPLVYQGATRVGKWNVFFMSGLAFCYLGFVFLGASHVDTALLRRSNWNASLLALPISFTAFAYQGIVPSLVHYLDRDPARIRTSIWIGTSIPLVTYIIWQALILGIVPLEGAYGLLATKAEGRTAVHPLKELLGQGAAYWLGQGFAFFALLTSFFGVTLGLIDFLGDGLQMAKKRGILSVLVFVPPLIVAWAYPAIFLTALDYAGGYGTSLLLGLLPIAMAWTFRKRYPSYIPQIGGGRSLLIALALFVCIELIVEIVW